MPLPDGQWPILCADFPMSEESWNQMVARLEAMKPGLVKQPDKSDEPGDED